MTHRFADATAAKSVLGGEHPLTSALDDVAASVRQTGAVAAVGGAGLLAGAAGSGIGPALALAAGLVAIVLGGRLLVAVHRARDRARDVIIAGDEHAAVPLVQRQRDRLLSRDVRTQLAGMYDDLARRAAQPPPEALGDGVAGTALSALADDLRGVARLLRGDALDARGVALAERLVDDDSSALHGSDVDALRFALHRIERCGRGRPRAVPHGPR